MSGLWIIVILFCVVALAYIFADYIDPKKLR
jgi:hypothetical protein